MRYQINKKCMYWYVLSTYRYILLYESEVCTRYILLYSSLYFKTYISYQFIQVCTRYIPGTYLREKLCSLYILGVKIMYRVHTGLCRFIAVPYYSMVHTGSYSVQTSINSVHTIGHDSRCADILLANSTCRESESSRDILGIS